MSFITELFTSISEIFSHIGEIFSNVQSVFADIDFSILYNWLPSDIASAITACIAVLFFLAIIALVKKIIFFFG